MTTVQTQKLRQTTLLISIWMVTMFQAAIGYAACNGEQCALPPGLFFTRTQLDTIKQRIEQNTAPYAAQFSSLKNKADSDLNSEPQPFHMDNPKAMEFGWCGSAGGEDNSLKDLSEKLTSQSNKARNLALAFVLTDESQYADKAKSYLMRWATGSTLLNMYELNINFQTSSFDGIEEGFCNNSWNMGLDSIWQTYGLINFSDTYVLLTRNGYTLSETENNVLQTWLREKLLPATNAGFHTWTRWADAHPSSSAYTRYRSDNHLSWSLAGLASAAAALNDETLWAYVYKGGSYNDGYSGNYANPSHFEAHLGRAIDNDGVVYDQAVRASEHKGLFYANFSTWALSLVAQIAEVAKGENYWEFEAEGGGSLVKAFDNYAPYTAGDKAPPDAEETTDPQFFRFMYEWLVGNSWVTGERLALYTSARNSAARNQIIQQSIGPVALVTGDFAEPQTADNRPCPPQNVNVKETQGATDISPKKM